MTEAEQIARGLTEAQREVFRRAKVREPHSFMPDYHAVEFYGGDIPSADVTELQRLGLMTLPIAKGGRGTPTYCGEIHSLGLAVRHHLLTERDADAL